MALEILSFRTSRTTTADSWRSLIAAVVAIAVCCGGVVYAANNSVQGAKKEEGGFDGDAPTAILIEASSGSVLFEKNADELRAPSSMMKLMTAEVVFHAIKEGEVKLTDEYRVSENAWRKGGAPSGGSTMFAAIHSKIPVDDLLHGAIIQSGNDACMVLAEGIAEKIVDFVGKPDDAAASTVTPEMVIEPVLLSLCCTQLNRGRKPGGKIDQALLKGAGESILEKFYKDALADADVKGPPDVALFVEDKLIQGGFRGDYPKQEALDEGKLAERQLAALTDRLRLLRIVSHADTARIELIHDRLVPVSLI